jgi:hypothetical protein
VYYARPEYMPSPSRTPPVLAVTRKESPVDRNQTKPAFNSIASASAAVRRGSLGMNFDRGGQNLLAQCGRALFISQGLQKELNCLADIDKCLLDGLALRLAPLQFWAPRVATVLVLFDYDANLTRHRPSLYRRDSLDLLENQCTKRTIMPTGRSPKILRIEANPANTMHTNTLRIVEHTAGKHRRRRHGHRRKQEFLHHPARFISFSCTVRLGRIPSLAVFT